MASLAKKVSKILCEKNEVQSLQIVCGVVNAPDDKTIRDKWVKLGWRDLSNVVTNSPIYFCEDKYLL